MDDRILEACHSLFKKGSACFEQSVFGILPSTSHHNPAIDADNLASDVTRFF
jgi:hypothetical protein